LNILEKSLNLFSKYLHISYWWLLEGKHPWAFECKTVLFLFQAGHHTVTKPGYFLFLLCYSIVRFTDA